MVYVTQAYPAMKPYLKEFHLSLEMCRGGQDSVGWKKQKCPKQGKDEGEVKPAELETIKDMKVGLLTSSLCKECLPTNGPSTNLTPSAPRFKSDLKAILQLVDGEKPQL
jgi:hypothetical protein